MLVPQEDRPALKIGAPPRVFDPFGGGGGFALEALKLGCSVQSNDINPMACAIQRATVEFPHRFGPSIADSILVWGHRVLAKTRSNLPSIYGPAQATALAFLWCWGVPCPSCHTWIPFLRSRLLLQRAAELTILTTEISHNEIQFGVRSGSRVDETAGNFGVGGARCLNCGSQYARQYIQARGQAGELTRRLLAVCERRSRRTAVRAPLPGEELLALGHQLEIEECFSEIPGRLPEELISSDRDSVRTPLYGMRRFRDLFLPRQMLVLGALVRETRTAIAEMGSNGLPSAQIEALSLYLGLVITRTVERNSHLCLWQPSTACISSAMARYTLAFVPDFAECNTLGTGAGSYAVALDRLTETVKRLGEILSHSTGSFSCTNRDATLRTTGRYDVVITDPPYFDSIAYAHLADYFYVWLRRTLRGFHLEWDRLLRRGTSNRGNEMLMDYQRDGGFQASLGVLRKSTHKALGVMRRALQPDGRLIFVFGCAFLAGWVVVADALRRNGFRVRSVWPVHSERKGRPRARSSRVLSCSFWLCCDTYPDASNESMDSAVERFACRLGEARGEWKRWRLPAVDLPWFLIAQSLQEFTAARCKAQITDPGAEQFLRKIQELIGRGKL